MTFDEVLTQALELLKRQGRVSYLDNVTLGKSSLIKGLYGKCPGRLRTLP
jgi:hypothetical protein